jgi:hypothetical protein
MVKIALLTLLACAALVMAGGPYRLDPAKLAKLPGRRIVGNGQCAVLVQILAAPMPLTQFWIPGPRIQGNTNVPIGTVLATFLGTSRDPYNKDGSRHTLFYNGQNAAGLKVIDQWSSSQTVRSRTLAWNSCTKMHLCGKQYYVVMSRSSQSTPFTYPPMGSGGVVNTGGDTGGDSSPVTVNTAARDGVRNALKQAFTGLGEGAISAIMGNIQVDNGFNVKQQGPLGFGLFALRSSAEKYRGWLASAQKTDSALSQATFAKNLIDQKYPALMTTLQGSGKVAEKTLAFMNTFTQPTDKQESARVAAAGADYTRVVGAGA